jgi:tol-pal system protein YbgF
MLGRKTIMGRVGLLAVAAICGMSLAGCLARTAGPSLPYVKPAQSVPVTDPTAVHMASRIDEMDGEIQRLREMIERQQGAGANDQVIRNLQDRVSAIESRMGMAPASAPQPPAVPQRLGEQPPQPGIQGRPEPKQPIKATADQGAPVEIQNAPVSPDEVIYKGAYSAFLGHNWEQSVGLFQELLNKFPQSPLAPDAIYWTGEARLSQGRYEEAVLQFDRVIKEYPGSRKELSALLKQGEAFEKMGDEKAARIIYQKIVTDYPHTVQGRAAAGKLKGPRTQQ